jgi:hypothetical protein
VTDRTFDKFDILLGFDYICGIQMKNGLIILATQDQHAVPVSVDYSTGSRGCLGGFSWADGDSTAKTLVAGKKGTLPASS